MKVLIVEDEMHTASLLKEIIEQDPEFTVLDALESVSETVQYLSKHQQNIDLLFLDIQLADGMSFELFRHIDVVVPVIFCTAYDHYSMEAIKNNGIDYVLKPFKEEEIHKALQQYKRLQANFQAPPPDPIQILEDQPKAYQRSFLSQFREKSVVKRIEEIALFMVSNETVYLHTFDGGRFPVFKKMEYLESVCDPDQFYRINRQMLISRKAIVSFEPYLNRKIILELKIPLEEKAIVSRLKVSPFRSWLEG